MLFYNPFKYKIMELKKLMFIRSKVVCFNALKDCCSVHLELCQELEISNFVANTGNVIDLIPAEKEFIIHILNEIDSNIDDLISKSLKLSMIANTLRNFVQKEL